MVAILVDWEQPNVFSPEIRGVATMPPKSVVVPIKMARIYPSRKQSWIATGSSGSEVPQNSLRTTVHAFVVEPCGRLMKSVEGVYTKGNIAFVFGTSKNGECCFGSRRHVDW